MKKIKVVFPDGSTAEIEEADLPAALSSGAKRAAAEKSTSMVFPDGSIADVSENEVGIATKAGAKKKVGEAGIGTAEDLSTGTNGLTQSTSQLPLQENNLTSPKDVFSFDKFSAPKVNVSGVEVSLKEVPIQVPDIKANPEKYAEGLQQRIDTKTFNPEDVGVVAKSMRVSPNAANAYLQGKAGTGSVIHFNDIKQVKANQLKGAVDKANIELGLSDNYDQIFTTPESVGAYLQKIEKLYENKAEKESISSVQKAAKENQLAYTEGFGAGIVDDSVSKETLNAAQEIKGIVSNDIIEKISADPTLSKDQKVKKIYKLSDSRDYKNVEKAISERLTPFRTMMGVVTGDNTYDDFELLNANKAGIELKVNRTLKDQIDYNNYLKAMAIEEYNDKVSSGQVSEADVATTKNTIITLDAENARISNEYVPEKAILEKYPVLFKAALADAANEYNAIKSGNVQGYEDGGFENVTLAEHLKAHGFDMQDQKVKDFLRGRVLRGDNLKDYSFFGRPLQNIAEVFINTAKSIGDITGIRDAADILADKKQSELFPIQVGEKDEYKLTESVKQVQNIANTTGQIIGQGVLQLGTAGLGRMAGLSKLASVNAAFWTSGTLTSYDAAYKDSYDFVDNTAGRVAYAGLIALANGASEKIFPEIKLFQIPGVKDAVANISKRVGTDGFTDELATELLSKAKNAFVDYSLKYGKNVSAETIEEVATDLFESGTRFLFGDPNISVERAIETAKNTAIQTAMGTSLIGGFGAHKDVQNERNVSAKSTIYNAAIYHDEALDAINKGYAENLYSENERNSKIAVLNTARKAVATLNQTEQVSGVELTRPDKELYVANLTAEALLTNQKKDVTDNLAEKTINEKISNLQNQRKQILDGEVNIDEDGNVVVKEADIIKEDTIPENIAQQAELTTEVSNAPLIDDLMKQEFTFEQKYNEVEFNDPITNENKKMSAKSARTLMEKRHNILDKIVNCLT